jgi:hypothetical protein
MLRGQSSYVLDSWKMTEVRCRVSGCRDAAEFLQNLKPNSLGQGVGNQVEEGMLNPSVRNLTRSTLL